MKLFIRAHDLEVKGLDNIIELLNSLQLDGVQMVAYKVLPNVEYKKGSITQATAQNIGSAFSKAGKQIALIGAYFNPVHSNDSKVSTGIEVFKDYLSVANAMGCDIVGSETGSYNDDKWTYNPLNRTDRALARVVDTFRDLAQYAKMQNAYVGMEGAWGHVCYCAERLDEALKSIGATNTKVIFDLYNYLSAQNVDERYQILERGLKLFGTNIEVFHLKDCNVSNGALTQCAVGRGIFDFDKVIGMIREVNPNANLVFEGTRGEDIAQSVKFIKNILNRYKI